MFTEYFLGHLVSLPDNEFGLGVDLLRGQFRIGFGERHVALPRGIVIAQRPDVFAHAIIGYHGIGLFGDTFQVIERPGRYFAEGQLLRNTSAERGGQLVHHLLARGDLPLFGQVPGCAERLAARDDRHLDKRAGILEYPAHRGVARLVVGDHTLLLVGDDLILAFEAAHDAVDGCQEVLLRNEFLVVARSDQRGFVADICNVGTRESGGLAGQERPVELRIELQRTQVDVENLLTFLDVGQSHLDLAVETAGAHQRLVEDVGTVRGRKDDHARIGLEAVHLREELVKRILTLVVAREPGILAAGAADGVNLVDENDARRLLLGLFEQVADTRSTHADEHLHEVGTRNREERHVGLACDGLRQQGLTRPRRAYEQRSLGNFGTQFLIFVGLLEEIHDLHDLDLGLLQPSHILERDAFGVILVEHLRLGLAHVHDAAARTASGTARHRTHDENPHADNQHPRQQVDQHVRPVVGLVFIDHGNDLPGLLLGGFQVFTERVDRPDREEELHTRLGKPAKAFVYRIPAVLLDRFFFQEYLRLVAVDDLDLLHLALFDHPFDGSPVAGHGRVVDIPEDVVADNERADQTVEPQHRRSRHVHIHLIIVLALICHI